MRAAKKQELLDQLKQRREEQRRRRRRWLLLVLLLLLLLLLCCMNDCSCDPLPEGSDPPVVVELVPTDPPEATPAPAPLEGKLPRRDRPQYIVRPPQPATWLDAFRLQVAARSPRLATCFEGRTHPGVLRWTTFVEPHEGRVSQHEIEAMLASANLERKEKDCVIQVLSAPPYDLPTGEERATPTRVGMVIEF